MAISLLIFEPGTIGSYSDLVAKVAAWLDRDDLTPRIPDFLALLESRLNRLLRTLRQETPAMWLVTGETFDLPSDFRALRKLHIEGTPDRPLIEYAPSAVPVRFRGTTGTPLAYFIENRTLTLAPPSASETLLRATYVKRIPPLSDAAPSNWLLEEHPDIYLWGALHQAAIYIRDEEAAPVAEGYLDRAIAELQRESAMDQHGGGPLVPSGARQVRGGKC